MRFILNKYIFQPTRHPIHVEEMQRDWVEVDGGQRLECFVRAVRADDDAPRIVILKLVGSQGRAENSTEHPLDIWSDLSGQVWASNPRGYGGTAGKARLCHLVPDMLGVHDHVAQRYPDVPIILYGNSLGAATALAIAAQRPVAGLILRDIPNIGDAIVTRWGHYVGLAQFFEWRVPRSLNAAKTARQCRAPAVITSSRQDTIVPPECQDRVIDAYGGAKKVIHFENANHAQPPADHEREEYLTALAWLRDQLVMPRQPTTVGCTTKDSA